MKPESTDDVLCLMDGSFPAVSLTAALELGLFWLLEARARKPGEVAAELGIPDRRCLHWLQLLEKAGLLLRGERGYAPTATARRAILETYSEDTWRMLASEARRRVPGLRDLTHHLSDEGSAWTRLGEPPPDYVSAMAEDPEQARRFTRALHEIHRPLAESLAESLELERVERLMDLGGGSGVISMALLRRNPSLTAVVVDLENVCAAGRELAAEAALENRITYHPADFLQGELPGDFDLVLECDVTVYRSSLFEKVRDALKPDGRFVIVDMLADARDTVPPSRLHWALQRSLIDPEARYPSVAEVRRKMERAGFVIRDERPLQVDGGPARFSDRFTVLEGRRRDTGNDAETA